MPYGIIINSLGLLFGGLIGCFIKDKLNEKLRFSMPVLFGIISMAMGITAIIKVNSLLVVVLAVIIGYFLGTVLHLEDLITRGTAKICGKLVKNKNENDSLISNMDILIGLVPLFCFSGTGVYGAMLSGFTGDHSILYVKTILDFFTSMVFAAILGQIVSLMAIPQFIILITFYLFSSLILPLTTNEMLMDFTACGGIIMLATGFRISQIKSISTVNLLPAFILVMPFSAFYMQFLVS